MSVGPPAANGTMMVIGRFGYDCALVSPASASTDKPTAATFKRYLIITLPPVVSYYFVSGVTRDAAALYG
jgi:hypothetical protein